MSSQSEDTELVSADHYAYDILDLPSLLTPLPLPPPSLSNINGSETSLWPGQSICQFVRW